MRVKYLYKKDGEEIGISSYPNFSATGSIKRMKKLYYGKDALLVRCGGYIYNVTYAPHIYFSYAH